MTIVVHVIGDAPDENGSAVIENFPCLYTTGFPAAFFNPTPYIHPAPFVFRSDGDHVASTTPSDCVTQVYAAVTTDAEYSDVDQYRKGVQLLAFNAVSPSENAIRTFRSFAWKINPSRLGDVPSWLLIASGSGAGSAAKLVIVRIIVRHIAVSVRFNFVFILLSLLFIMGMVR